jgi:hypothetical protein
LPTARPLLVLHRTRHRLWHEGYLVTEKLENALELQEFVRRLGLLPVEIRRERMQRLLRLLGRLIRELHGRRLSHRDLKSANLLVRTDLFEEGGWNPPGGLADIDLLAPAPPLGGMFSLVGAGVWFIDLVGVRRHEHLKRERRIKDLTRLHASFHQNPLVTRTDKLRFLRTYLTWGLRGRQGWKHWWKAIARATRAKVARNQRSGRPLA